MNRRTNGQSEPSESHIVRLKEYEVIKKLGRGGMGIVYLVRHRLTKRLEVLKVLRPDLASRPRLRERFLREVQAAARLDHPNIVKTFTAIQSGDMLGLVMEYVDGSDLESMVQRSGPLTVESATRIIRQAALGLQHASDRGLIHRDIKPSNILVSRAEGHVAAKLSDFGLSKLQDEPANDGLTVDGRFLGTPDYMAPEQGLDASSATVAADIYGLGCSLYYALVGRPPYAGSNALAILNAHINATVPDARLSRHDVPFELSTIMHRMMQKDPRGRYAAPSDVAAALAPFTIPGGPPASVTPFPSVSHPSSESPINHEPSVDGMALADTHQTGPVVRSPIRKRAAGRRGRNGTSIAQTLLQLGMPIALLAGLVYLQPWVHLKQTSDGTLRIKELTPGTVVEIDNSIRVAPETGKSMRDISLSPGVHRLRFLHGAETISQRSIEIKPNGTVELSASFVGLGNKARPKRAQVSNAAPPRARTDEFDAKQLSEGPESS
ncbi:MAG: serine/threonine-protein kinase, partial [Aureliella sp.]